MAESRATLFLALRLVLPALAGIAIAAGLGGVDLGAGPGQRAVLIAAAVAFGLSWIVARRVHSRLGAVLLARAQTDVERRDDVTGLGNDKGLMALLSSDLRGINTLVVFETTADVQGFTAALREASRPEQDHLFHIDEGLYAALLTGTSPSDAEVVIGRLEAPETKATRARMRRGESAEAWLQRARSETPDPG